PRPRRRHVTGHGNAYDRYYFNCHARSDWFLVFGLGRYPNRGVQDAFACFVRGDSQRVVRASRALGATDSVGPFRVIAGPHLRAVLEPNEFGLDFDLTWEPSIPETPEPRHLWVHNGEVMIASSRVAHTGRWTGSGR